jgi:uncharacterized protein (DUF1330 family)
MIAEIEVRDPEVYAQYTARVKPLVESFGGRYLARGGPVVALAGNWEPERILVIAFPDSEALYAWLRSPAYADLAPLREQSTTSRAIVVEGLTDR